MQIEIESMQTLDHSSFFENAKINANATLAVIGESPINLHSIPKRLRTSYCTKKVQSASKSLAASFANAVSVDVVDVIADSDVLDARVRELECNEQDFNKLMEDLEAKFSCAATTISEKIQILTLKPDLWSNKKTMDYFNCSKHLVNKAAQIKNEIGVLAKPKRKQRVGISMDTKSLVLSFFEDDDNSRMLPGIKDRVSVGRHNYHQKRLLLCTVKELYAEFKKKCPDEKIRLSKFFELRPKWCVAPGASGTHRVCVCSVHQNGPFLAEAFGMSYCEMMAKIVCDISDKMCMVHGCKNCPGEEALIRVLRNCYEEGNDEPIQFQQWESTDRAQIVTISLPVEDFIENIAKNISN